MAETHRITISIPEELDEKIRKVQGEIIKEEARNFSFQDALFLLIQRGLGSKDTAK